MNSSRVFPQKQISYCLKNLHVLIVYHVTKNYCSTSSHISQLLNTWPLKQNHLLYWLNSAMYCNWTFLNYYNCCTRFFCFCGNCKDFLLQLKASKPWNGLIQTIFDNLIYFAMHSQGIVAICNAHTMHSSTTGKQAAWLISLCMCLTLQLLLTKFKEFRNVFRWETKSHVPW